MTQDNNKDIGIDGRSDTFAVADNHSG